MGFLDSDVRIANLALTRIGEDTITDFDEATEAAPVMKLLYPIIRDEMQEKYNWKFCLDRATLARHTSDPDFEWSYQYILPADCLRVYEVYNNADVKFAIEGNKLLCNETTVQVKFVKREVTTTLFSPAFVKSFYLSLGMSAIPRLTSNRTRKADLFTEYEQAIAQALTANAIAANLPTKPRNQAGNYTWAKDKTSGTR